MPNMEYCAFENTCRDLEQIVFLLDEADSNDVRLAEFIESRSSAYEKAAVTRIARLCADVLDLIEAMAGSRSV